MIEVFAGGIVLVSIRRITLSLRGGLRSNFGALDMCGAFSGYRSDSLLWERWMQELALCELRQI